MPKIELGCGKTTCYREPGKPCVMLRTMNFGTVYLCALFERELKDGNGDLSGEGWLMRLPECLKATTD